MKNTKKPTQSLETVDGMIIRLAVRMNDDLARLDEAKRREYVEWLIYQVESMREVHMPNRTMPEVLDQF